MEEGLSSASIQKHRIRADKAVLRARNASDYSNSRSIATLVCRFVNQDAPRAEATFAFDIVVNNVQTADGSVHSSGLVLNTHPVALCTASFYCCDSAHGLEQLEPLRVRRKRRARSQAGRCHGQQWFESRRVPICECGRLLGGPAECEWLH